jgi:hypothetical protein
VHPKDSVSFDDGCSVVFQGLMDQASEGNLERRALGGLWP